MSCENCLKGTKLPGEPSGSMVDDAYLAASSTPAADDTKRALALLTDIFGLPLKNSKIQADRLAKELDIDVWIPDLFAGRPPVKPEELEPLIPDHAGANMSFMSYVQLILLMLTRAYSMYVSRPTVGEQRTRELITMLRNKKGYVKIGRVGYCHGGTVAALLGKYPELVDSAVIAHPGAVKEDVVKAIKIPTSWACAEEDMGFTPAMRNAAEAVFKAREGKEGYIPYEFKDWKGCAHGFAIRPNQALPDVKAGYEGATAQTVEWFKKTLF